MASNIAIIPARGNSKRIPEKNIKDFFGKPLVSYSIEAAIESKLFERVIVSTESNKIAEIARSYGAEVPFLRSEKNASDTATTADVLLEVIDNYRQYDKLAEAQCANICCIYPTAIFFHNEVLRRTYDIFCDDDCITLLPVVEVGIPVQQCLVMSSNEGSERIGFKWPEYALERTQDLPKYYIDSGQFYWLKKERFLNCRQIFNDNTRGFIRSPYEVQDVDSLYDWSIAELKFKLLSEQSSIIRKGKDDR